ncbi:hypothetical protein H5410_021504 [Solanum commersonii]|uniref:Uncharacterized protein n=1 Tax=Solanum commersonii TaxID=4109 RepID=A0A9J5ZE56_SOLCO|nr:hypothetical protein H5410_021504 [Solanum commersonii]
MNLMSTHSVGHQSSSLGFATSRSSKPKTHERIEKTHFQFGEDELPSSSLPKTLSKLERKYLKKTFINWFRQIVRLVLAYNIFTFWTIGRYSNASKTIWRSADCSFHLLFDHLPSVLCILEQRVESILTANRQRFLAMLMLPLLRSFQPSCSFLRLSVHASTKTSNT